MNERLKHEPGRELRLILARQEEINEGVEELQSKITVVRILKIMNER
jgi:hypothetical protein